MIDAARRAALEFVAAVDAVEPFGAGLINDSFLVTAGTGEYVLQRVNTAVFGDPRPLMQNIATVAAHLGGQFAPELVATKSGAWFASADGDAWRVWRRVPDAGPADAPTPARVASAARLLARFHRAIADLDPARCSETIPHFHDPARRLAQLRETIAADPVGRVAGVRTEIEAVLANAALAQQAAELVANMPRQVAHNDAALANFLFRADEAVCLVDFDTVMPTAAFWDVGDLIRSGGTAALEDDPEPMKHRADPALLRAMLDGYREILPAGNELEHAGVIITYEQGMRFLTDWIVGDVYYRTARPAHNLDRARGQLVLLASLQATFGG